MRHCLIAAALIASAAGVFVSMQAQSPRLSSIAPPAQFADSDRISKLSSAFPEIDRLMREFAEGSRVPGIAYGIIVDGRVAHVGTHGRRDVGGNVPVDADTVFRIASMTKSYTAAAILQLRDAGRLSL